MVIANRFQIMVCQKVIGLAKRESIRCSAICGYYGGCFVKPTLSIHEGKRQWARSRRIWREIQDCEVKGKEL